VNVRDAVVGDAEAVREVHRRSIEGLGPEAYGPEQVRAWAAACESADYAAAIEGDGAFLVAEPDQPDGIVGFGSLSPDPPEGYAVDVGGEITAVYVAPEVARRGVGTALYRELERRARRRGVHRLGLLSSRNAVAFYEAHGYGKVRERDHEFSAGDDTGVTGIVVEMVKPRPPASADRG
jgi:putative acetyltransferase